MPDRVRGNVICCLGFVLVESTREAQKLKIGRTLIRRKQGGKPRLGWLSGLFCLRVCLNSSIMELKSEMNIGDSKGHNLSVLLIRTEIVRLSPSLAVLKPPGHWAAC